MVDPLSGPLGLAEAPVGVAFLDHVPDGIEHLGETAPAGCAFWHLGRERVFWTEAADHAGCPIGTLAMGLAPTPEVAAQAEALVGRMEDLTYLSPGEAASLPRVDPAPEVIVYGPLDGFPIAADVVLVTATPEQTMWMAEAAGSVDLAEGTLRVHGRPACAAIPRALDSAALELSLGCAGMRTFTAVEPGMLLSVIPVRALDRLEERLPQTTAANAEMRSFYEGHVS